jgi:hypothetical protein
MPGIQQLDEIGNPAMHAGLVGWIQNEELGLFTRESRFGRDERRIEGEVKFGQLHRSS